MAGYSGTPLAQKLGIKPGSRVLVAGAPRGFEKTLEGLPPDAKLETAAARGAKYDVMAVFVTTQKMLTRQLAAMMPRMQLACGLWFAWPKKASGVATDVTEDAVRDAALAAGLVDNKVCAIDQTWSGLRVVIRVKDRPKK
ncbi:MAG: DUF3052 domain-containing protein [Phycisphaerales bacterium]